MSDWARLQYLIDGIRTEIGISREPRMRALSVYAAEVDAEIKNKNEADFAHLDLAVKNLWEEFERKPSIKKEKSWGPGMGMAAVGAVIVATGYLLWKFVDKSATGSLTNIDGVRPILTFAAIISTVGFGGALVFAALFATDANFETRFRTSREIFLVFSSVFATVVGFHFGTGAATAPPAGTEIISVTEMKERGNKLYLTVTGGTPPYTVESNFEGVRPSKVTSSSPLAIDMGSVIFYDKPMTKGEITVSDSAKGMPAKLPMKGTVLKHEADIPVPGTADAASPAAAIPPPAALPAQAPGAQPGK